MSTELTQVEHDDGYVTFVDAGGKTVGAAKLDVESGRYLVMALGQTVDGVQTMVGAAEAVQKAVATRKRRQQRAATQAATGSRGTLAPLTLTAPGNNKLSRLFGGRKGTK